MDWQDIRKALCDARRFEPARDGFALRADTMMPSGAVITIHVQMRNNLLSLHDNGAAFDELVRHGRSVKSIGGVQRMLTETGFELQPTGEIFRHNVNPVDVALGVSLLADASLRAAQYLLSRSKAKIGLPLDVRLKEVLAIRYPNGHADFKVEGMARQQKFDFGIRTNAGIIVLEAVTPDPSSVNAAIVKSLDAAQSAAERTRPILVYDDDQDDWPSDTMGLLGIAKERASFRSLRDGQFKLAA